MQREAWRLADKYDTDGANVINIMMKRFGALDHPAQDRVTAVCNFLLKHQLHKLLCRRRHILKPLTE